MDMFFWLGLFAAASALLLAGIFLRMFFLSEPYGEWVERQREKRKIKRENRKKP